MTKFIRVNNAINEMMEKLILSHGSSNFNVTKLIQSISMKYKIDSSILHEEYNKI